MLYASVRTHGQVVAAVYEHHMHCKMWAEITDRPLVDIRRGNPMTVQHAGDGSTILCTTDIDAELLIAHSG